MTCADSVYVGCVMLTENGDYQLPPPSAKADDIIIIMFGMKCGCKGFVCLTLICSNCIHGGEGRWGIRTDIST